MTRIFTIAVASIGLISSAAPALAGTVPTSVRAPEPSVQRVVMQCDTDAVTLRSFRREHGSRAVFITADQALSARATGQTWSTPRCMNSREHARLVQTMSNRASTR